MEIICPIDKKCAAQISSLLQTPSPLQVQEYFDQIILSRQCRGIKVKQSSDSGKGVYADVELEEKELVLKDQMLAGIQHSSNKIDCLVCSFCFRFIGSVELQIGRKLYLQSLGKEDTDSSSDEEDGPHIHEDLEKCASGSSKRKIPLPKEFVESLMNGGIILPHSSKFPLSSAISCPGGCQEAYYCSKSCAEADWELFHSLLCTGERSESLSREALSKFIEHANGTNDIFLLAAKAICLTISRYRKLKATHFKEQEQCISNGTDNFSLLLESWKPISIGYKRRWWDCIALPDDVDSCDEASFRMEIKELAFTVRLHYIPVAVNDNCKKIVSRQLFLEFVGLLLQALSFY